MGFSDAPGPATLARQVVAEGETVLWAAHGSRFVYDVARLDEEGRPQEGAVSRGLGALGRGAANVAVGLVAGVEDDPGAPNLPPDVVVFGDDPGCLARTALRDVPLAARSSWRTWALTSARLLVLDVVQEHSPPREGSLLRKTLGWGMDIVNIVTDRTKKYGENVADVPVTCPPMTVSASVDRGRIGELTVSRRRLRMRTRPCFRVSFVDGSGVDLLLGVDDESVFEWMLALSRGGR